jgi:hypothetical protein
MPCQFVMGADGSMTILCGPRRASRPPCVGCGQPSSRLCDFPLSATTTCSAALCARCTQRVERDRDRCPDHRVSCLAPTRQLTLDLEGR